MQFLAESLIELITQTSTNLPPNPFALGPGLPGPSSRPETSAPPPTPFPAPSAPAPHDDPDALTDMSCLPDALARRRYYHPTERGLEPKLKEALDRARQRRNK